MSPSSVLVVMAMVHAGARGNTESQMTKALRLEKLKEKGIHAAFEGFVRSLKQDNDNFTLTTANKLYPNIGNTIKDEYVNVIKKHFMAAIQSLDYASNTEGSRIEINKWVEGETKEKIKDLLAPGTITHITRLVVVNAIYFKGDWATKFDAEMTSETAFYVTASKTVQADMMYKHMKKVKYGEIDNLDCTALELPYKGGELSMRILLPNKKDGLASLEAKLTASELMNITPLMFPGEVKVSMPKFKLESTFSLSDCLQQLGMTDAFDPNKANLSGMSDAGLFVSEVVHKAYVDVNEEGTEAAAATAAVFMLNSMPMVHTFAADHPFLFIIQDNRVGVPLFIGRVVNPSGGEMVHRQQGKQRGDL